MHCQPCRFYLPVFLVALYSTTLLAQNTQRDVGAEEFGGESPAPSIGALVEPEGTEVNQSDTFDDEAGVEYMTRGPLHESYAEPYSADPQPSPTVPKEPPQPIKELPPTLKPETERSTWIPGYWDWDVEREDFIWISGVWRELPPGRRWVPGYWEQTEGGYRRVSGFWANDESATVEYLPLPPESVEQGPSSPAPGDDYFYVPGNWSYQTNEYQWTPGFWARCQPDWVWVPNQYVWTPRGCIFRTGYWDHRFHRRGILFTPVYYQSPIYLHPNYWYRPRYVVNSGLDLLVHLFVNPRFGRYYFGDYYGGGYGNNFYPWISYFRQPRLYDPLFSYHGIPSLNDRGFSLDRIARGHQFFHENKELRPPHTYAEQLRFQPGSDVNNDFARMATLGKGLENFADRNPADYQFRRLSDSQASSLARQAGQSQDRLLQARKDFERFPSPRNVPKEAWEAGRQATPFESGQPDRFRLPGGNDSPPGALSVSGRGGPARGRSDVLFDRGRGSLESATRADRAFSPGNNFGSGRGNLSNRSFGFRGSTVGDLPSSRGRSAQLLPPGQQRNSGDPLGRSERSGFRSAPPNISHSFQPGRSFSPGPSSPPTINRGRGNSGGFPGMSNRGGGGGRGRGNGGGGHGGPSGKGRGR